MKYLAFLFLLFLSVSCHATAKGASFSPANTTHVYGDFMRCLSNYFTAQTSTSNNSKIFHTRRSSSYSSILQSSEQNPRWLNSSNTRKPLLIVTPTSESEIRAAIVCTRRFGLQLRILSGGHDYEGQSFLCNTPFVILDMVTLRSIEINLEEETAWVQSGATIGELYYHIAKKSPVHGFPAGLCPTVGIGGHLSGGGLGTLMRKYGLAADNVMDAYLVDVNGRVLDREAMGEDLFWAIRGGGGASFGVIVSWKIKLVRVPPLVTGFTISKTLDQGAAKLVQRWQYIADKLDHDLFIRILIQDVGQGSSKTTQASFNSMFLGPMERLIPLMNKSFPELGLEVKDCIEMSWVQSTLYFAGYKTSDPLELLLSKRVMYKSNFKAKSDYVTEAIPEKALQGAWERFVEEDVALMIMDPLGGKMSEISETAIPYPHRKGNIYNIQYIVKWEGNGALESDKHEKWMRELYKYMEPYVSKNPRAAYLNYRDLELGTNNKQSTSFSEASLWGLRYFKSNFKRLAQAKTKVDPNNFFRYEQSIPLLAV